MKASQRLLGSLCLKRAFLRKGNAEGLALIKSNVKEKIGSKLAVITFKLTNALGFKIFKKSYYVQMNI